MRRIIGFFNHFLSGQIQQGCMGIKSGSERWSVHSQTNFLGISASHFPWSKSIICSKKSGNLKNLGLKTVSLSYCIVLHQVGGNFTTLPQFFKWDIALNVITHMTVADVPVSWVWLWADFQSGSRVLKKVSWAFSYLYLWHTKWFHAKKLLKTLKFWKSLNLLCKSGSRH